MLNEVKHLYVNRARPFATLRVTAQMRQKHNLAKLSMDFVKTLCRAVFDAIFYGARQESETMMMELVVEISVMAKLHLPEGEAAMDLIMSTPGSDVLAGVLSKPSPKTIGRQMLSAISVMGIDVAVIDLPSINKAAQQVVLIPTNTTSPACQILPRLPVKYYLRLIRRPPVGGIL